MSIRQIEYKFKHYIQTSSHVTMYSLIINYRCEQNSSLYKKTEATILKFSRILIVHTALCYKQCLENNTFFYFYRNYCIYLSIYLSPNPSRNTIGSLCIYIIKSLFSILKLYPSVCYIWFFDLTLYKLLKKEKNSHIW